MASIEQRQAAPEPIHTSEEDRPVMSDGGAKGGSAWGSRSMIMTLALAVAAVFAYIVWQANVIHQELDEFAGAPLITADTSETRVRPDDPGGMSVPHQDKTVLNDLGEETAEPEVERLLPPTEEPIERPVAPRAVAGAGVTRQDEPAADGDGEAGAVPPPPVSAAPPPAVPPADPPAAVTDGPPPAVDSEAPAPPPPAETVAETPPPAAPETAPPAAEETPPAVKDSPPPAAPVAEESPASPPPPAEEAPAASDTPVETAEAPPAAAPPPAATPPATASAPAADNGIRVQIAAYRDPGVAERAWEQLVAKAPTILGSLKPDIMRVDLGPEKGTFYRLRASPFASGDDAKNTCDSLKDAGIDCIVLN